MLKVKVGDPVVVVHPAYERHTPQEAKVVRVGRKWFYVEAYEGQGQHGNNLKFSLADGTPDRWSGRAWIPADWVDEKRRQRLLRRIEGASLQSCSLAQLEEVWKVICDS